MLSKVTWAVRLAAVAAMGLLTFTGMTASGRDLALEAVAFGVGVVATAYWFLGDVTALRLRGVMVGWAAMAIACGLAASGPEGGALIAFPLMAALAAGADTDSLDGWVVGLIAVLAVDVGALLWSADTAQIVGYPLSVIVAFIVGRNRRSSAVQVQQAASLLAQSEQLRAEQRRVATLDERARIAREIHDVLAHSLGALGIQIQTVRAVLTDHGDVPRALALLEQAQRMATGGLVDTRRAVHALRADTTSLDQQIVELVEEHRARHHTSVDVQIDGPPATLSPEATVALVRTTQEALVNSAKHARLQPVEVTLRYDADGVRLVIRNTLPVVDGSGDGSRAVALGADEPAAFSSVNGGYGLMGMRERLLLINGTLTTGSDDRSWTVDARVPAPASAPAVAP